MIKEYCLLNFVIFEMIGRFYFEFKSIYYFFLLFVIGIGIDCSVDML